jgi:hypothetical protein
MPNKPYPTEDKVSATANEPAVAYRSVSADASSPNAWSPNTPFCGTQEEWWDHFHQIENGKFYTPEEADEEFEVWKKAYLASRM